VQTIYAVFCAMRLLLGVGVGGMYPLSASHSAEGSGTEEGAASRVGWAFFWQTPGSMAPYAVALLMLFGVGDKQCSYFTDEADCMNLNKTHNAGECQWNDKGGVCMFGEHDSVALPSFEFRFLVGLGALPAFIVMLSAMKETDSTEFTEAKQAGSRKGICQEISEHPEYWKTLIGTGGTWFLYDVSYYGTASRGRVYHEVLIFI
jgi:MFS family permease